MDDVNSANDAVYSEKQFKLSNTARGGNSDVINIKWLTCMTVIDQRTVK